ncbi:DNA-binding protein WhiA [[Mycoplasma] anseris]|nr:DNA-binding protein WhiA [[Mycoplasma] anseris]
MKKSFSQSIKQEIITKPRVQKNSNIELLNGIFATAFFIDDYYLLTINTKETLEFIINLLNKYNLVFQMPRKNQVLIHSKYLSKDIKKQGNYFAGVFLSGGSISDVHSTSYHLELKLFNEQKALEIRDILNKYDFNFKLMQRNNAFFLYIKKVEAICDFLKAIEALESYLEFEETKIERDFKNNINRLTNFDIYNQQRIANSNQLFLNNWNKIKQTHHEDLFSENELLFFNLKEENLDSSLNELVILLNEKHKIKKAKSTLNNYLLKLSRIVKKINQSKTKKK